MAQACRAFAGHLRPVGVGGRSVVRSRVPRAIHGAAAPGIHHRIARTGLTPARAAARPHPCPVGDVPDRGTRRRQVRALHEDASRPRRRCGCDAAAPPRAEFGPRRDGNAGAVGGPRHLGSAALRRRYRHRDAEHCNARCPRGDLGSTRSRAHDHRDCRPCHARSGGSLSLAAPQTILNVPIAGSRRFAARAWRLERLRMVAKASDSTLNDVVLAMCSGALRAFLAERDSLPDESLVAMVPVACGTARTAGTTSVS